MNEQALDHGQALNNQIIDLYGQLLLDSNLIFAGVVDKCNPNLVAITINKNAAIRVLE